MRVYSHQLYVGKEELVVDLYNVKREKIASITIARSSLINVIKTLHDYAKQLPAVAPWDEEIESIDDINNKDLTRRTPVEDDMFPYMTVPNCILANAIRHMWRAGMHAANGNFDYADISAEKAIRNFRKAAEFDWDKWLASPTPWSKRDD